LVLCGFWKFSRGVEAAQEIEELFSEEYDDEAA
jgi:hypothetical protein